MLWPTAGIGCGKSEFLFVVYRPCLPCGRAFLVGGPRYSFSFVTKREAEKSRYFRGARLAAHNERRHPAELARSCASKPHWGFDCFATVQSRPRGYSPLGTPKRRSKKQKAKTCRSAARFLTLFASSPIDPSGAKTTLCG